MPVSLSRARAGDVPAQYPGSWQIPRDWSGQVRTGQVFLVMLSYMFTSRAVLGAVWENEIKVRTGDGMSD